MSTPLNIAKSGHPKLKKLRQWLAMNAKDDVKGKVCVDEPAELPKVSRRYELFNRSSPMKLVGLSKSFNNDQKELISKSGFGSFVSANISELHPEVCKYLMDSFDPDSCELGFNDRGSLPIKEEAVHRVLEVPMGKNAVKYYIDTEVSKVVFDMLQIKDGKPRSFQIWRRSCPACNLLMNLS